MKKTIKKLPKSQILIEVTIPQETFESYRDKALAHMGEHMEITGFRKGKAPKHIVEKSVKQSSLLEEMAQHTIGEHFSKILVDEKIDAIGRPKITITKLEKDNEFEFNAVIDVFPDVELPEYKKIAAKVNKTKKDVEVTDEELDKAIIELKKARAHSQKIHDEETGEEINHEHKEGDEVVDANLTDDDVKKFGPFETVADFKEKYRANIKFEKESQEREKRRVAILDGIIGETTMELPDVLIESELENLLGRIKADLANSGLKFEDYLTHIKKTEEDLRAEYVPDAEKRAKMEFIMYKIGDAEKLVPKQEEIDREVKRLMEMYNGADEARAKAYVTHLLSNEEIFRFLENQE